MESKKDEALMGDKDIKALCHVNQYSDDNCFVGIKADSNGARVFFPFGYDLPKSDKDIRLDISRLIRILATFKENGDILKQDTKNLQETVNFPLHAYLQIVRLFLRTGRYFIETEPHFRTDIKGNVSWDRTIKNQKVLIQKNGTFAFTKLTIRSSIPDTHRKITQIHKYCVYEAFEKIGWLFIPYKPLKPLSLPDVNEAISIIKHKITSTFNDSDLELFKAMLSMLTYIDNNSFQKESYFGTYSFEYVWEQMIDRAFGIRNKEKYMPRTKWQLVHNKEHINMPLKPDSIMLYGDNIYILDAKFYRYGVSGKPDHLPSSADINKQITYAEYIEMTQNNYKNIYNAFIMPFNSKDSLFHNVTNDSDVIKNIGEALSTWKSNSKSYERIQGIVIDTRFLMRNYLNMQEEHIRQMAMAIQKVG